MRIKKIKLVVNPKKQWAIGIQRSLASFLENSGYSIADKNADLTICIGGDGTILYANHDKKIQGAVLGIGGDKSKICILNKDNWRKHLLQLLKNGKTENRQILHASATGNQYTAINDFVIHTHDYRVIELNVQIDGMNHHFEGDGLIVSSATGSLAYAYSAGGKKLAPRSKKIQAVPIAPYLRAFKPHTLPSNSKITISADRTSAFIVDGIFICTLKPNQEIKLRSGGFIKFLCK